MFDFLCEIKAQRVVTDDYMLIQLQAGELADQARPGQFVHIRIPGLEQSCLRRPFSIFDAKAGVLSILYKAVGRGTEMMRSLQLGRQLQVIGPLGNGFPLEFDGIPLLVAGGYGVAPLHFLASRLQRSGVMLVGGRTSGDILAVTEFEALGWRVAIATEDGSAGDKGFVTVPLVRELARFKAAGQGVVMFACGPDGMLRAVAELAHKNKVKAWLSLDKHMVCGVGACLACVQKLRREDGSAWVGRVCKDGPIFEAASIIW
ncbi:MAG: dihydroorotate dehydrogenase electron transfer subunit [Kiritimatiellae bacterium]|nr:dihydroorotate dehydrogenase electron transfer subunit [Kiritimatiellia bacterium]